MNCNHEYKNGSEWPSDKVGQSVVFSCSLTDQIRLEWFIGSIRQVSAVKFFRFRSHPARSSAQRGAAWRNATRRIVWDSGVAVWDACVALALRRSPCTPALLRATDGDESTRRRASSFLVASGRGCYTLSVRSTTPNWPHTTRRRSHQPPSPFSLSLFLSFLLSWRDWWICDWNLGSKSSREFHTSTLSSTCRHLRIERTLSRVNKCRW